MGIEKGRRRYRVLCPSSVLPWESIELDCNWMKRVPFAHNSTTHGFFPSHVPSCHFIVPFKWKIQILDALRKKQFYFINFSWLFFIFFCNPKLLREFNQNILGLGGIKWATTGLLSTQRVPNKQKHLSVDFIKGGQQNKTRRNKLLDDNIKPFPPFLFAFPTHPQYSQKVISPNLLT